MMLNDLTSISSPQQFLSARTCFEFKSPCANDSRLRPKRVAHVRWSKHSRDWSRNDSSVESQIVPENALELGFPSKMAPKRWCVKRCRWCGSSVRMGSPKQTRPNNIYSLEVYRENRPFTPKGKDCIPTIHFPGSSLLNFRGVSSHPNHGRFPRSVHLLFP